MFVVTGAAGRLGNVLVRMLRETYPQVPVRALALPGESTAALDGVECEIRRCDIRDLPCLTDCFQGARAVFHVAGFISLMPDEHHLLESINVQGTANVIAACRANKVHRLVYTASAHALEEPEDERLMTEAQPFSPERAMGLYGKSKAKAAQLVLQAADDDLEAVIVCPTGILGPLDHQPSHQGRMLIDSARRALHIGVNGAYDFVDVRDVAQGHILAYERGRSGEYYVLSGERISIPEIMRLSRQLANRGQSISITLAGWFARWVGRITPYYYRLTRTKPAFTSESVDIVFGNSYFSNRKARTDLGYAPRPIFESIRDSIAWFEHHGYMR